MGFGDEVPWAYGLNEIDTLNQQLLADSNSCGTSLWKDIERRYTFSVLGLPLSRHR